MSDEPVKAGVIGCGNICRKYLTFAPRFDAIEMAVCADIVPENARAMAEEFAIPRACSVAELLADDAIEIVLNLTIPAAHAEVALAALDAGKHVYSEKPLSVTRDEARQVLAKAREEGLRVGCAPDTFLGAGLQTCRKLIDDGAVGEPVGASAFMLCHGHESWHPSPEFYYKVGGGPMFDMGPYYLTALVNLLGPVRRVAGAEKTTFRERTITSEPKAGQVIQVETPTHIAGLMEFAQGAIGTIVMSFDVWGLSRNVIEIYGTEGTLGVPDPNGFGGPVRLRREGDDAWRDVPLTHANAENSRIIGVADLACALRSGRPHRAGGALAFHVLDIMHAFHDAADAGRYVALETTCERPAPLPAGLADGALDA